MIYLGAPALTCPLGDDPSEVHQRMCDGDSGLSEVNHDGTVVQAGVIDHHPKRDGLTRLESMLIDTVKRSLGQVADLDLAKTQVFVCTTKGNIDLIEGQDDRVELTRLSSVLQSEFGLAHIPQIISHACISGIVGVITAARWIEAGNADHCIVVGGDLASHFTLSGFLSLHAVSEDRCRPYDESRDGINLGEAAACLVVSKDKGVFGGDCWQYRGGAINNDANHISGPSRTGEGLHRSIERVFAGQSKSFDFISAHGTGTVFNDEMESIAFERSGINHKPVHSLKWYLGHTLGAAGLIETVIGLECLRKNQLVASGGFQKLGTSKTLDVINSTQDRPLSSFLKTASGFGGCNASMLISNAD